MICSQLLANEIRMNNEWHWRKVNFSGQILEMWTDPSTGKTYLRTKSGRIVSEVDENMVMYTDPKTGKRYLAAKAGRSLNKVDHTPIRWININSLAVSGAQKAGVFTDPKTGKVYLRTASGRIIEAIMDASCEIWPNALQSKMFLRTNSGSFKSQTFQTFLSPIRSD